MDVVHATSGILALLVLANVDVLLARNVLSGTESGRYYVLKNAKGAAIANVCLCSRKDFRDAVVAARAAQSSWAGKSA